MVGGAIFLITVLSMSTSQSTYYSGRVDSLQNSETLQNATTLSVESTSADYEGFTYLGVFLKKH